MAGITLEFARAWSWQSLVLDLHVVGKLPQFSIQDLDYKDVPPLYISNNAAEYYYRFPSHSDGGCYAYPVHGNGVKLSVRGPGRLLLDLAPMALLKGLHWLNGINIIIRGILVIRPVLVSNEDLVLGWSLPSLVGAVYQCMAK